MAEIFIPPPDSLLVHIQRAKLEWEATVDSLPHLICLMDADGLVWRASRMLERWNLGLVKEARGKTIHALLHSGCHESTCYLVDFSECIQTGVLLDIDQQFDVYDDCLQRYLQFEARPYQPSPYQTPDGQPRFFTLVISDITRQHQLTQQVAQNEAHYRSIYQHMPLAYQALDAHGRLLLVNEAWQTLLGYSADHVLGRAFSEFANPAAQDPLARALAQLNQPGCILDDVELDLQRANRLPAVVMFSARTQWNERGELEQIHCVLHDVTERRRSRRMIALRNRELQALHQISEIPFQTHSLGKAFELFVQQVSYWTEFPIVAIEQYQPENQSMCFRAISGITDGSMQDLEVPLAKTLSEHVVRTRTPLVELSAAACKDCCQAMLGGYSIQTFLALPLVVSGKLFGVLSLSHPESLTIDDQWLTFCNNLANTLSTLIERMLAEEQTRFHATLLDAIGQAVVALDRHMRVIYWNRAAEALYGWPAQQVLGQEVHSFLRHEALLPWLDNVATNLQDGLSWQGEIPLRRLDGSTVQVMTTQTPVLDENGNQIGLIGITSDLSERVRTEEALRNTNQALQALNQINAFALQSFDLYTALNAYLDNCLTVLEMDGGWLVLQEGERLLLVTGQGSSETSMQHLRHMITAPNLPLINLVSEKALIIPDAADDVYLDAELTRLEARRTVVRIPVRYKETLLGELSLFSRRVRHFAPHAEQVLEALGGQLGLMIENLRLAGQAAEVEILREVDQLRSDLLANVSHELRTPLGLIKLYATTLLRKDIEVDAATRQEFLSDISEETDRLEETVADLLDLSRLEAGRFGQQKVAVDLIELVQQVAHGLETQSPRHPFVYDLPAQPLMLLLSPAGIGQVLRNLLVNAIKYSPDGGEVSIRVIAEADGARLIVSDRGIGIQAGENEKIFQGFYRVNNDLSLHVRGAGLGLAICRKMIEAHGGRIWVESEPGQGSSFICTLPALQWEQR